MDNIPYVGPSSRSTFITNMHWRKYHPRLLLSHPSNLFGEWTSAGHTIVWIISSHKHIHLNIIWTYQWIKLVSIPLLSSEHICEQILVYSYDDVQRALVLVIVSYSADYVHKVANEQCGH